MLRRMRVHAKYRAHALFGARKGLPTRETGGVLFRPLGDYHIGLPAFLCLHSNETLLMKYETIIFKMY